MASFTGDALIRLADNTQKPIADIVIGDKILSYDIPTGDFSTSTVQHKKKRYKNEFYHINNNFHTTEGHPFYVSGSGLVSVEDLKIGDKLVKFDKTYEEITSIDFEKFGAHIYNMSLDGNTHTYFANDVLTHNSPPANTDSDDVTTETVVTSPKYPYTEISFDNFRVVQDQPRIEMSSDGFLMYQSEVSYFKMTPNSFLMRTPSDSGMGIGSAVTSQMDTTNTGVFGQLDAPVLQPYDAEPNNIDITPFAGGTDEYARGNHRHDLTFSTLDTVAQQGTFTNIDTNGLTFGGGGIFALTGSLAVSSSVDSYFIGGGGVGIGTTNSSQLLHIYKNDTSTANSFTIEQDGTGDSTMRWLLTGATDWTVGIDNSQGDSFKIAGGSGLGTSGQDAITILKTSYYVGIGTTIPTAKLHVAGDAIFEGTVTAQEFHAEFVSSSIIYESGSTKFGNSLDDYHDFTGSLHVSGTVHHILGDVGIGVTDPEYRLDLSNSANDSDYSEYIRFGTNSNVGGKSGLL